MWSAGKCDGVKGFLYIVVIAIGEMKHQVGCVDDAQGLTMLHQSEVVDDPHAFVHLGQQLTGQGFDAHLNRIHAGLFHFSKQRRRGIGPQFGKDGQIPAHPPDPVEDRRGLFYREGIVGKG